MAQKNKQKAESRLIGASGGYRKMFSFGFTCLVYHATTRFCRKVYNYRNDPLGKTSGQMIGSARAARQNIAEGSARAGTSKETELRLYDVAKASLEELAGDYEAFLVDNDTPIWSEKDERFLQVSALKLDEFTSNEDVAHRFSIHIIAMRKRFSHWLEHDDSMIAANAILVIIFQAQRLLFGQMRRLGYEFLSEGGFRERMTRMRLQERDGIPENQSAGKHPDCPKCGSRMHLRKAKKGPKAGQTFWGCEKFPECDGTRAVQ